MTKRLGQLSRWIDCFTEYLGRTIAWLTLVMMLLTCVVVVMRYFLEIGSIALQESVTYLHALVFLMGIAYTLKHDGHVRVDIFYQHFSPRQKALVDVIGGLVFLIPVSLLILLFCWDYVASSWAIREVSKEAPGLPWVYLLKSLLILMPLSLLLQGTAEIIKNLLFLNGVGGAHTEESTEGMI